MKEAQLSPTPWRYDPAGTGIENILDANGHCILDEYEVPSLRNPADAERIVIAVNAHDRLLSVAKNTRQLLDANHELLQKHGQTEAAVACRMLQEMIDGLLQEVAEASHA